MSDFIVLIGQIFVIALLQLSLEVFIDPVKRPYLAIVVNVACFLGSLYFVMDFMFNKVLVNLSSMIRLPFF